MLCASDRTYYFNKLNIILSLNGFLIRQLKQIYKELSKFSLGDPRSIPDRLHSPRDSISSSRYRHWQFKQLFSYFFAAIGVYNRIHSAVTVMHPFNEVHESDKTPANKKTRSMKRP